MAKKLEDPEVFILKKKCRVKEHGKTTAEFFPANKKVTVSGQDKVELLSRGLVEPVSEEKK